MPSEVCRGSVQHPETALDHAGGGLMTHVSEIPRIATCSEIHIYWWPLCDSSIPGIGRAQVNAPRNKGAKTRCCSIQRPLKGQFRHRRTSTLPSPRLLAPEQRRKASGQTFRRKYNPIIRERCGAHCRRRSVDTGHQSELLKEEGFEIVNATDGESGLESAERLHPSPILLDLRLPVMGGEELLERLRGVPSLRWIPVIAISGGPEVLSARIRALANRTLRKPFDVVELLAGVHAEARTGLRGECEQPESRVGLRTLTAMTVPGDIRP